MSRSSAKIYGRDKELGALRDWLKARSRPPLAIIDGPSGSGKEYLAQEFFAAEGIEPTTIPASAFLTAEGRSLFGRIIFYTSGAGIIISQGLNVPLATVEAINSAIQQMSGADVPIVLLGYSRQWEKLGTKAPAEEYGDGDDGDDDGSKPQGSRQPVKPPIEYFIVKIEEPMPLAVIKACAVERNLRTMTPDFLAGVQTLSQHNFSRLINILNHCNSIKLPAGSKLNVKTLAFLKQTWMTKSENKNLYDICRDILTRRATFEECLQSYKLERSLLPLLLHENFQKFLPASVSVIIGDLFSLGDLIDVFMFYGNEWELEQFFVFVVVWGINLVLRQTNPIATDADVSFTKLLNKTSLKHVYYLSYKRNIPKRRGVYFYPNLVRQRCKRIHEDHKAKTPAAQERVNAFMAAENWNMRNIHRLLKFLDK